MNEPAIRVAGLSKQFKIRRSTGIKERFVRRERGAPAPGMFWALKDATFEIPAGSMFGIVGHNGSGKSTALKVLAGIYRPTSGEVDVRGRMSALLELGAGFHPELTGRENIALNGALLGMSRQQVSSATEEIIEFSGLEDFIDAPLKTYSSGMQVRLGFAIAVKVDPDILVIDEVIAVGDEDFQRKCFDYIYDLRSRGATVVIVTHAMGIVADMCDQAMWLDHGEVQAIGPAREVVDKYIAAVNRAEARSGEVEERKGLDLVRMGSGQIKVVDVEVIDGAGEPAGFFISGEPGGLRLHFQSDEEMRDVKFALAFFNQAGIIVTGPHSGQAGVFDVPAGTGHMDFIADPVLLSPGTYKLSTMLISSGSWVDGLDRAFQIRVRTGEISPTGLMLMPGRWQMHSG